MMPWLWLLWNWPFHSGYCSILVVPRGNPRVAPRDVALRRAAPKTWHLLGHVDAMASSILSQAHLSIECASNGWLTRVYLVTFVTTGLTVSSRQQDPTGSSLILGGGGIPTDSMLPGYSGRLLGGGSARHLDVLALLSAGKTLVKEGTSQSAIDVVYAALRLRNVMTCAAGVVPPAALEARAAGAGSFVFPAWFSMLRGWGLAMLAAARWASVRTPTLRQHLHAGVEAMFRPGPVFSDSSAVRVPHSLRRQSPAHTSGTRAAGRACPLCTPMLASVCAFEAPALNHSLN